METVGAFEAKTHLSALLERAYKGETIIITKHGTPIARLVPPTDESPKKSVEEAVAGLLEFRKKHRLDGISIRDLIDEGRKY